MHGHDMTTGALVTSPEAAAQLGVSVRTIHRLVTSKQLTPAMKLPGPNGAFLFDPAHVQAYAEQRNAA